MPHDGLPVRAVSGVHAARADRRGAASARLSLIRHVLPAAAVAGATMLAFAACSGTTGGGSAATSTSSAPESSSAASTEASMEASSSASTSAAASGGTAGIVTVIFKPENGSQILGGAVLTDQPDGTTQVQIGIGSTGATDGMPAILEQGSCADLASGASSSAGASGSLASGAPAASSAPSAATGGSAAPSGSGEAGSPAPSAVTGPPFQLMPLTGGASTTLIATTTSNLLNTPSAIVLNKSAKESTVAACADITNSSVRVPASAIPSGLVPSTGTEPSPSSS